MSGPYPSGIAVRMTNVSRPLVGETWPDELKPIDIAVQMRPDPSTPPVFYREHRRPTTHAYQNGIGSMDCAAFIRALDKIARPCRTKRPKTTQKMWQALAP